MYKYFDKKILNEEIISEVEVVEKLNEFLSENEDVDNIVKLKIAELIEKLNKSF
ncbi:hypothetical protein EHP00_2234 [Ecytonucleospora hepatopenaei]|uniref:Uncharacterized protein n=1 Tax=Ecytonucleospora hepatopenaei TaxID=646526 RepID=A0A1W0E4J0_9MICR|nr:hypothetical protein EHP00_2234 [Ecytonucleospora hepatopenaei]